MVDEPVRSVLAMKALAQKALRDEAAATAAEAERAKKLAARTLLDNARSTWRAVLNEYQSVVNDINVELLDTGTSARLIVPKDGAEHFIGSLSVSVQIESEASSGRYHALHMTNDGQLCLRESMRAGGIAPQRTIDKSPGDVEWIAPAVRAFFDRALS